ncbi:MAG: lipoyl(octanoyl) transferase LipB [Mariprofundaceae bacterium]|nr:lipoyl(octanoyl) transferase LipB [Mariprofundaceae bacterium]
MNIKVVTGIVCLLMCNYPFPILWHQQQSYPQAMSEQASLRDKMLDGNGNFALILTEHPPIYTLGTSGSAKDVLQREVDGQSIEVFQTGRGGEVTYHGPGQLLCYVVANLAHEQDLHQHIWRLEEVIIRTLAVLGVTGLRDDRGIGVWVDGLKIAAAGVRCRRWVVWHGIALNIKPNLNHFKGIIPCGMRDAPVTSLANLGLEVTRESVETILKRQVAEVFSTLFLPAD